MSVTFASIPLLLHDPDGSLSVYIDRFLDEHGAQWFGRKTPSEESLKQISIQRHPARVPMPAMNWPTAPKPRINHLWCPSTGATRWSVGLFLIDGDSWDKIRAKLTSDGSAEFIISDDRAGGTVTKPVTQTFQSSTMFALTPHMIAASSDPQLMILPIVDERYWWQFKSLAPANVVDTDTQWEDLFGWLTDALGPLISVDTPTVDDGYGFPDPLEFARPWQNAAQLLDAVCASVGCRFVYDLVNGGSIDLPSDAEKAWSDAQDSPVDLVAGGANSETADGNTNLSLGETPVAVNVLFPEHIGKLPTGLGNHYSKQTSADDADAPSAADQPGSCLLNIFSTAAADITGLDAGGTPHNKADLDALAKQIATDLYGWTNRMFDQTCAGLWDNTANGYEDYQWIKLRGTIQTRVASLPQNVMPHTNWCQVTGNSVGCCGEKLSSGGGSSGENGDEAANHRWPGPTLRVILKEPLYGCGSAKAAPIYRDANGQQTCDENTITITDPLNKVADSMLADPETGKFVPCGTTAEVEWWDDSQEWEVKNFGAGCTDATGCCEEGSDEGSSEEGSEEGSSEEGSEEGSEAGSEGGSGSSGGGGGGCAQPCCPDTATCDAAPLLKATVNFPAPYVANSFTGNLNESSCNWGYSRINGPTSDAWDIGIICLNGCWVIHVGGTVGGTGQVALTSDPVACGSPYPPSGTYVIDIQGVGNNITSVTVVIGKQ